MRIRIDGCDREVRDQASLDEVLRLLGEETSHALVEVNGVFVHRRDYERHILQPGDSIEVIYPAFGG